MNNITPKEAIANLNHIYGMVAPDIQRSLDVAIKALENQTTEGDLISRDDLKKAMWNLVINENDDIPVLNAIETIDNAPPVEQSIKVVCRSRNWSTDCTVTSGFEDGYRHGYRKAKEDVAERIKEQYNEHHELIPYWLSVGDLKGGAE